MQWRLIVSVNARLPLFHAHHPPLHPRPALRRTLEVRRPRAIGPGLLVGAAGCGQGRSAWRLVVCAALRCRAAAGDVAVGGSAARHALAAGAGRCGAGSARADAALAGAAQRWGWAHAHAVLHPGAAGRRRGRAATAVRGAAPVPTEHVLGLGDWCGDASENAARAGEAMAVMPRAPPRPPLHPRASL